MVKKKGGRELNPIDAFRKSERAKQVSRNKKERHIQREAHAQTSDPAALKAQLKEVLDAEEEGTMNPTLRLKKKALQQAYNQAIQKQMEKEAATRARAQAAFQDTPAVPSGHAGPSHALPPLPGHFPNIPLPPGPPPPLGHMPYGAQGPRPHGGWAGAPLPPPLGPPPSPPPAGYLGRAIPGSLPLPPPQRPPPPHQQQQAYKPLAAGGPQGAGRMAEGPRPASQGQQPVAVPPAVIAAKSTVVALPKAQNDAKVTSMVPSSLLARRGVKKPDGVPRPRPTSTAPGYGLLPQGVTNIAQEKAKEENSTAPVGPSHTADAEKAGDSYESFMESMRELGAL